MVIDLQAITVKVEGSTIRADDSEVIDNTTSMIATASTNWVTKVNTVLNTRNGTSVIQSSLKADTVNRSESTSRPGVAFRSHNT